MNREEFAKFMIIVKTLFETKAVSREAMDMWHYLLKDLDHDLAVMALYNLARIKSGWIYPADIRRAYEDIINPQVSFTEAYQLMNDCVRKFGRYQHEEAMEYLENKNPVMHAVVHAIGYQMLCSSNPDYSRGIVERMYKEVQKRGTEALLLGNFDKDISGLKKLEYGGE